MSESHIFISYSSQDREKALLLAHDLAEAGYRVWFDRFNIEPSESFTREIESGIDNSFVLIAVWTKTASDSSWVQDELARARMKNIPVIPLQFDDTPPGYVIQTTQHIDFRTTYAKPFTSLVSHLSVLVTQIAQTQVISPLHSWAHVTRPNQRSRFLFENNYQQLDSNFAANECTEHVIDQGEQDEHPVTFVCVANSPVATDFTILPSLWKMLNDSRWIGDKGENNHEMWFGFGDIRKQYTNRMNYVLYTPVYNMKSTIPPNMRSFLRFHAEGNLEYGSSNLTFPFETRTIFNFVPIIGTAWKFTNLAVNFYKFWGYTGKIQFLLNLRNAKNCGLDGFPSARTRQEKQWNTPFSRHGHINFDHDELLVGVASDLHLQFCFDIHLGYVDEQRQAIKDMVIKLSHELQRSFNYSVSSRHYYPDTEEFAWNQYYDHLRY